MPVEDADARLGRRPRLMSHGGYALCALIGLSALAHVIVSFSRSTIVFFPDEYLYSELSRSLSSEGLPLVRGTLILFPSLLQPIFTAPCWLVGSVETGFRASMVIDSIAMSLAALPVYWLGRRLGLSTWLALAASALALATPSMFYSSWLLTEALAYPLFVASFSTGVLALSGDRRWLIPALVVSVLASLARIQLVVLPLAFALAAVLMAARERRFRRFVGQRRYLIGAAFLLAIAALVVPASAFGFYSSIRHLELVPGRFALHLGTQLIGLLFACSWIVAPGALIGLGLAFFRPRSRIELGFACSALVVTIGLLLQASFFGDVTTPQERYLFYCAPVFALCLALVIDRGWPLRRTHALLVLPILVFAAVVPISTYAVSNRYSQSGFLFAAYRLQRLLGVGSGALLVAVVVSVLALATLALPFAGRLGGAGIFVLAIAFSATALGFATDLDLANSTALARVHAPDKGWIDKRLNASRRSNGRAVLLLGKSSRASVLTLLFWNRSLDRAALLPDSTAPDALPWPDLKIGDDGSLSVDGNPITGPVVIDRSKHTIELQGAVESAHSTEYALWLPRGRPRFALYASGFSSGQIYRSATLAVWPAKKGHRLAGFLSFRAKALRSIGPVTLSLSIPGAATRSVRLRLGESRLVRIAVCDSGAWRATINAKGPSIFIGSRLISAGASAPVWRVDAAACARPH